MPEHLKGFRILILEDEYFLADDLAEVLRAAGAEVLGPVARVDEAASLIAKHVCHAAVLDIKLADQEVHEVADELARRQVPFVFVTGYGAKFIPDRFRDVMRWEKPFETEKVVSHLVQMLRTTRE